MPGASLDTDGEETEGLFIFYDCLNIFFLDLYLESL